MASRRDAGTDGARRRVGIRDVARRAGVGMATVSRVLSGVPSVSPELRRRVLAAAAELGYEPDIVAQSLRRGASRSVGFIADDLSNHLFADIATGAERVLRAEGYSLLVMNSEMDARLDPVNIRVLRARRVDALMMAPVTEDDDELVTELTSLDIPLVVIEGDLPPAVPASFVNSDHRHGVRSALRDLVGLGHERIGVITGPATFRSARQRRLAVDDVLADVSPRVRITSVVAALDALGGRAAAAGLIDGPEPPSAIVVGGSQLLIGVIEVLRSADLAIGRDLSLVTTDPLPLARVFEPPLAAITRDSSGLGAHAAELLLKRLRAPATAPEEVILPTTYERRASVGPPALSRPAGAARG